MQDSRICLLFARKLSGEATPSELDELHTHLTLHPNDQYLFDLLLTYWSNSGIKEEADEVQEEESIQRIFYSAESPDNTGYVPHNRLRIKKWLSYAAALLILVSASYTYIHFNKSTITNNKPETDTGTEVTARPGSTSKMVLPDGSQVWLNAASKILYQKDFNNTLREVYLEGEAFFDITRDVKRPFIVHTSGIDIRVFGTSFNVKSYASDATIETTLLHGSIEISKKNDPSAPKLILRPNDKVVYNKASGMTDKSPGEVKTQKSISIKQPSFAVVTIPVNKPDSLLTETSWRYNKLIFEGDSFEELAVKMERWYDVSITIKDERLKQQRVKGIFTSESILQALEALKLTAFFKYKISGNEIEIYNDGNQ